MAKKSLEFQLRKSPLLKHSDYHPQTHNIRLYLDSRLYRMKKMPQRLRTSDYRQA